MTGGKRGIGTDWAKADAYVDTPEDYEELPELDDSFFERATLEIDGKPVLDRPLKERQHVDATDQSTPRRNDQEAGLHRRAPSSK